MTMYTQVDIKDTESADSGRSRATPSVSLFEPAANLPHTPTLLAYNPRTHAPYAEQPWGCLRSYVHEMSSDIGICGHQV